MSKDDLQEARKPPLSKGLFRTGMDSVGYVIWTLLVFMGTMAVLYVGLAVSTRAWQYLVGATLQCVSCAGLGATLLLLRRGQRERAAWVIIIVLLLLAPAYAMIYAHIGVMLAIIALLFPLLFVVLLLPRRRIVGAALALGTLGAVMVVIVDRVVPWSRLDVSRSVVLMWIVYGSVAVVVMLLLWQLVRFYQRANIRFRLLTLVALLALLVATVVGLGSVLLNLRYARQQAFAHLKSVVALKERSIDDLLVASRRDLDMLLEGDAEGESDIRLVLAGDESPQGAIRRLAIRSRLGRFLRLSGNFREVFLLDMQGNVVVASDPLLENKNMADEGYFLQGASLVLGELRSKLERPPSGERHLMSEFGEAGLYPSWDEQSLFIVRPVKSVHDVALGMIVGRVDARLLSPILEERAGLGKNGEVYLVDVSLAPLTTLRHEFTGSYLDNSVLREAILRQSEGTSLYKSYDGREVLAAYKWLPALEALLVAEYDADEVSAGARATVWLNGALALLAVLVGIGAASLVARTISAPLAELAGVATRIASGELELVAQVGTEDEIGLLARAFNSMTARLRESISTLEDRIAERTRSLWATAEVSRATTSLLDPDLLLRRVVDVIRERFDLYYVGLFLLDEERRFAVLRAGTGEAGRQMLARGHRLEVGGNSMIGQCVASGEARIAMDVGMEAIHFDNPLLPKTRSELALPLRARGRIIGAMTVQSEEEAAFDETDVAIMQAMADQVAVAIDNARLFSEMQAALEEVQSVHRRYLGQAWEEYISLRPVSGYEYAGEGEGIRPLEDELRPEVRRAARARRPVVLPDADGESEVLVSPVVQGDRVVAALGLEREGRWNDEEVSLVEEIALQFGLAADNLRLLDESQRRAARERVTREIVERIRAALNVEEILAVAARSLSRELAASEVVFRLGTARTLLGRGKDEG